MVTIVKNQNLFGRKITMFRSKYEDHDHVYSEAGSPIKIEYQLRIVDNAEEIVETGKSNLYDYIQSHADSVDITKILERCALIEDYSMLNRMPTQFMDVTEMPQSLAEAYAQVQDAKNFFERMPIDIKESYNNNFVEFLQGLGDQKFQNVVIDFLEKEKIKSASKEEVKSDES